MNIMMCILLRLNEVRRRKARQFLWFGVGPVVAANHPVEGQLLRKVAGTEIVGKVML